MTPRAIVTDIEGTTSSLAFVHDVLFPYSRARLADYVAAHPEATASILADVRVHANVPAMSIETCIAQLGAWHDADLKIGPLKTLQGLIWAEGYENGGLKGHVYADAVEGLRRWRSRGIPIYVYSSGSVAAQKLLFRHSDHGDLTPLFAGHFDTAVGAKRDAASYGAIAAAIGAPPEDILFLSDVEAELDAAAAAGMAGVLICRDPGVSRNFPVAADFDAILPDGAFP
jgi:enolase-phosphatase E1